MIVGYVVTVWIVVDLQSCVQAYVQGRRPHCKHASRKLHLARKKLQEVADTISENGRSLSLDACSGV